MDFKELCPAGPGYQYSASARQFNQRVSEQLGRHGALLVTHSNDNNHGNLQLLLYFEKEELWKHGMSLTLILLLMKAKITEPTAQILCWIQQKKTFVYQITVVLKKLVLAYCHCPLQQQLSLVGSDTTTHLSEAESWTTFFWTLPHPPAPLLRYWLWFQQGWRLHSTEPFFLWRWHLSLT